MADCDDWDMCVLEPLGRKKKYRVCGRNKRAKLNKRWTVLLSVNPFSGDIFQINDHDSPHSSPLAGPGPGGHKASFKSTKLARRARSFKEDFLEKINQMRSPTNQGVRSHSPKSPVIKTEGGDSPYPIKGPIQELDLLAKQIQIALKHFRDVVAKRKLEMLPGNGTIVLETVATINHNVKSVAPEASSSISSATHQLYQSMARLIKLCDDALIDDKSSALDQENVGEVVSQVEDAVQNLIKLAKEKNKHQNIIYKTTPRSSYVNPSLEMPAQRNSLPDIPLTPRERQILEQTAIVPGMMRSSHSSESILRDPSPPPKPPLPDGFSINICRSEPTSCITPPPLPPKRKNNRTHQLIEAALGSENSLFASSLERMSLRSKSPEDSSSMLSESAGSLDSMLNHSKEEEEIRAIMDHSTDCDVLYGDDISDLTANGSCHCSWDENLLTNSPHIPSFHHSNELMQHSPNCLDPKRLSNTDSGFISLHSQRNSSYSKRSSQQSSISTTQFNAHSSRQSSSSTVSSEMVKSESVIRNMQAIGETFVMSKNSMQVSQKMTKVSSSTFSNMLDQVDHASVEDVPPAIPQKQRKKQHERQPSPYDNVPDPNLGGELVVTCQMHQSHQSISSSTSSTCSTLGGDSSQPPPLPPKKKHIMAYMEMIGNCSHANNQEFTRHSVHTEQTHWVQQTPAAGLPTTQSCSFSHSSINSSRSSHTQIQTLILPNTNIEETSPSSPKSPNSIVSTPNRNSSVPPALPPKRSRNSSAKASPPQTPTTVITPEQKSPVKTLPDLLEHTTTNTSPKTEEPKPEPEFTNNCDIDLMEETEISKYLVLKKPEEDGPEIKGGTIDALIIQATKANKNGGENNDEKENEFTYQEAFLTTYRTFISPYELLTKLIRRYNFFHCQTGRDAKPRSIEAFSLIVRVVSDLTSSDLDITLQQMLMDFVQQLISNGELTLAKALRVKHLERHDVKLMNQRVCSTSHTVTLTPRTCTLLDFKSEHLAEQMTCLDSELFMKIEIPEVLIWAQEQNEERSPNLTRFTEHFNKMSYWARTRILSAEARDREKYFMKYIKIMKHLRKMNNFNSYLALLSALDSAPVRRLEWQKHVQEGLKEYCALIDSSSSFRAYRQALAETTPPCIPYIGLVLQDLTFVHIGNMNLMQDGMINFSKRWQQFNIVENMKKFKKETYNFKKNDRIIAFFANFDEFINEDAMWQLSESIKPRGGKKVAQ